MIDSPTAPDGRPQPPPYDAIVLAGGAARRFGSDKLGVVVEGVPLLDRTLGAVAEAQRRILVGPPRATRAEATWTREEPPGSGPANAVVAGLRGCAAPYVVLLAGDLPYVSAATVERLLGALTADPAADGALLVDADGRAQHLCSAWRRGALVRAVGGRADWADASLRSLIAGLETRSVATEGREARDIDRPEDLTSEP
ncbi:molybdenum cofactor guanylyltransferase [Mumia sp. DW29H23]|uniref:molybdenum cofactor guanylyltransferase n=1 Tax=Mumia sp. DW29H23 TaxID=3421241 RepID=UPI003D690D65